ncbi:MFS transporter [Streptomyces sp. NPDC089799]|uniref:MFS transporter n=1 Tax=Streptomyces sp. NPDC089799 TaxID=3155066 RepID=UPI0034489CCC
MSDSLDSWEDSPGGLHKPTKKKRRTLLFASDSIYRLRDFRLLFFGSAISMFGTEVGNLAVPLVAVMSLDATAGQVGLLSAMSTAAFLLIGLPAGAWVDRLRRRPVMILADFLRAALFASIPLAWWLDVLSFGWLMCVVFACGVLSVFFDLSSQSFVPSVVKSDRLVDANSRLGSLDGFTSIAGPSLGGLIVQAIGAPLAVLIDAVSYLWSSLCIALIRHREEKVRRTEEKRLLRDVIEGVKFVWSHPLLRALSLSGAITNFSYQIIIIMMPVLYLRELGLTAGSVGVFLGCGGVGALLGALTARSAAEKVGHGRLLWTLDLVSVPFCLLLPLSDRGTMLWLSCIAWGVIVSRNGMKNVIVVSFRQTVTPARLLGRMSATMRFILFGALTAGSGVAAVVGSQFGVRAALWVGSVGLAMTWIPIVLSPLRAMRSLPSAVPDTEPAPA